MASAAHSEVPRWPLQWWIEDGLILLATGAMAAVLALDRIPLGLLGEWVWNRAPGWPAPTQFVIPVAALIAYALFVNGGYRVLRRRSGGWAWILLPLLLAAGAAFQFACVQLPPPGFGPERWPLSLYQPAASGYFTVARQIDAIGAYWQHERSPLEPIRSSRAAQESQEPSWVRPKPPRKPQDPLLAFLAHYHEWIADQDSFHIGTHPPGLILLYWTIRKASSDNPPAARWLLDHSPQRILDGLAVIAASAPLPPAEQAAMVAVIGLTWLLSLLTLLPLYALIRCGAPPATAWLGAALWPTVGAVLVFLPVSDCLYPVLAVLVLLLVQWALAIRLALPAVLAGMVWCLAMAFSVAFLAVLPIALGAATLALADPKPISITRWLITLVAFAAGWALPTEWAWYQLQLNLPVTWGLNLAKHAGFYRFMPRSTGTWLWLNLVEFAVVIGPTVAVLALASFWEQRRRRARPPRPARDGGDRAPAWSRLDVVCCLWLFTVLLLDASGRNRSEVARLWLFLMPLACAAAARAADPRPVPAPRLFLWIGCQAMVTFLLVVRVEPLLPVPLR